MNHELTTPFSLHTQSARTRHQIDYYQYSPASAIIWRQQGPVIARRTYRDLRAQGISADEAHRLVADLLTAFGGFGVTK